MDPLHLRLSGRVTVRDAERSLSALGVAPEHVRNTQCDLSQVWDLQIGAGERLAHALRRFQSCRLDVIVPGRQHVLAYRRPAWDLLFDCGLGNSVATYATSIDANGVNVAADFRDFHRNHGSPDGRSSIVVVEPQDGTQLNIENLDAFRIDFYSLLSTLGVSFNSSQGDRLTSLVELVREAILNISDHATRAPFPPGQRSIARFSLSRVVDFRHLAGGSGLVVQFAKRVAISDANAKYLRIVVSDDGVGIAARTAQSNEIYWGPIEHEVQATVRAFEHGFSIKPFSFDAMLRGDPGFGFSIMSLRALRAFASIRTGRTLAFCDGTSNGPFSTYFRTAKGAAAPSSSYLPGTLIEALIPIEQ